MNIGRRDFLRNAGVSLLAFVPGQTVLSETSQFPSASQDVRIASNPALENATLNELIKAKGYLDEFGVHATVVTEPGAGGPLQSLVADRADICLVSGYNQIIPSIENGAPVKIVGGAMLLPAHALYTTRDDIQSLQDLIGKNVGVGPNNGLLHVLMIMRLRKARIDPNAVNFIDKGGNANVYNAVITGEIDAGLASISNLSSRKSDGTHVVKGGEMWKELKEYTFQTAYATDRAIATNREGLVRTLAAYSKLYRFLQSPDSKDDFFSARRAAQQEFDAASAESIWEFIQENQPYAEDLLVSEERINTLQELNVSLGLQQKLHAYTDVADMSLARDAAELAERQRRRRIL